MNHPFFSQYPQRDILIRQTPAKNPDFYRDIQMMFGVFLADLKGVQALLPQGFDLFPLRPFPGKALVGVTCFEFFNSDVGDYNEVAFSIGLLPPGKNRGSSIEVIKSMISKTYHSYVCQMPVNTELSYHGGVDFFNYPKYISKIEFKETPQSRICTVKNRETGDLIFSLAGEKIKTKSFDLGTDSPLRLINFETYPIFREKKCRALFKIRLLEAGEKFMGNAFTLHLGDDAHSNQLKPLQLSSALFYTYAPKGEGVLFETEEIGRG